MVLAEDCVLIEMQAKLADLAAKSCPDAVDRILMAVLRRQIEELRNNDLQLRRNYLTTAQTAARQWFTIS